MTISFILFTEEGEVLRDFQKKILPWSDIQLDDELSRTSVRTRKRQSLILVATLIDKIPNLAGESTPYLL